MNVSIFYFLHSFAFQYQWFDILIWFLSEPFIYIIILLIIIILIWKEKIFIGDMSIYSMWNKGRGIVRVCLSTVFAYAIANLLKVIIKTDRPPTALSDIQTLLSETGYAFPSGHSATIAAFAFAVFFINKKLGYICFFAMLLIGIARVVAGVHFPIDIIGGYALGFLVAYFLKTR